MKLLTGRKPAKERDKRGGEDWERITHNFNTTWKHLCIATTALTGLTTAKSAHALSVHTRQTSNISTISWTTCPDVNSTQCGLLDVPMDYTNPDNGSKVSIFLRKYSATAPSDQRLGSILVNPGGPGGSGSAFIATTGETLSAMVDGRYDVISFDSRAVNLTAPSTACHDTEYKFMQRAYQLNLQGIPPPQIQGEGEIAHVTKLAAIQSSHPAACLENGNHEMLRNSGTVAVAKDMEKIVEALGEDGLNYIGYSYGTILGATFAAIRPNLVKRMVLDGVSDAEYYFNDIKQWARSGMEGTNKTLDGFVSTCIEAGPTQCALAVTKDNKTETIEGLTKRLEALNTRLEKEPLVVGDSLVSPGIVQAHNVQGTVLSTLYAPNAWSALAKILATLEKGDGRDYYPIAYPGTYGDVPTPYTQNVFNRSMQTNVLYMESIVPIMCGDTAQLNITSGEYAKFFRELRQINPLGGQWGIFGGGCSQWPFRATERYTGPWTVEKGLNKTRFPILFVSLDADPVTPLSSAVKMSKGFGSESATLLIQQGFGHSSLAHPSLCTAKNIRGYFIDGTVPKNGTYCTPEPGWIYPTNSTSSKRSMLTKRDKDLLEAVEKMARSKLPFGL